MYVCVCVCKYIYIYIYVCVCVYINESVEVVHIKEESNVITSFYKTLFHTPSTKIGFLRLSHPAPR